MSQLRHEGEKHMKRCSYRRIASRIIIILALGLSLASPTMAAVAPFTEVAAITDSLTGVAYSSAAWGDYDNDGDLDILLTGYDGARHAIIYRNDAGTFVDIEAGLTGVSFSSVAWGDYDNDGDLDILLTGADGSTTRASKVYRNDGDDSFTDISAGLPGVGYSSVAWGDYDNDGDLDILLTGYLGSSIARLYRNDGDDSFTDISVWLDTNYKTAAAWGDYDNDGDLDILLTRSSGGSQIYENNGGSFTPDASIWLQGVFNGSVAWGDYDNDGDLDILLSGEISSPPYKASKVYRNDAGSFADIYAELEDVDDSAVAWGDYDNDGDLDILLTGNGISTTIAKVYQNDGEDSFTEVTAITDTLTGVAIGSVAWGDYDTDGDLDILLTGYSGASYIAKVYQNNSLVPNNVPTAPTGLESAVVQDMDKVSLTWSIATDADGGAGGLSYNLQVGTTSGGWDIVSPHADATTGYRLIPALGNAQENLYGWNLYNLPDGTIYWSVQSIDHAFAGSAFAAEQTFEIAIPPATPQNLALGTYYDIGTAPLTWDANTDDDFLRYRIYMDIESGPETLVDSTDATNITITGLDVGTPYYFRIKAVDAGLLESVDFSNEVSMTPALYSMKTDSLALVDLYNATDGDNWTYKINWLSGPVTSWYRVTVTAGRVAQVTPSSNNLSGTIPSSIGNLDNLTNLRLNANQLTAIPAQINNLDQLVYLYLTNNQLVDLPDLTALTSALIRVDGNKLTFEDIEPNIDVLDDYTPQDSVGAGEDTTVEAGDSLTLFVTVGGTANYYQWYNNGYTVQYATDDTLTLDPVGESDAGDYVCRIKNSLVYGLTLYSRPIHVAVINTAPTAPQNLVAVAAGKQVTLTWDQNTEGDFLRYRIYGGTAVNPTTPVDSTSSITETTKILTGLTIGTTYYYRITAVDVALNKSGYSNEVIRATPAAPQNLAAEAGNEQVTLTWNQNTEANFLRYRIYRGTSVNPTILVDSTSSITETTRTLSYLASGFTYYFRITAVDVALIESGYSNEVSATPTTQSVSDQDALPTEYALHPAYPNPFNPTTTLRFDLPEAGDVTILVYDLMGREVARLVERRMEPGYHAVVWYGLDEASRQVPTGVYIVRMESARYTKTIKMVLLK